MSDEILKQALEEAIAKREKEIAEFRQRIQELDGQSSNGKPKRRRKATGLKPGGIPSLIFEILRESGKALAASEIADKLAKHGKKVESRFVASAVNRYVENERVFERSPEGLYSLRKDAA